MLDGAMLGDMACFGFATSVRFHRSSSHFAWSFAADASCSLHAQSFTPKPAPLGVKRMGR